MASTPSPCARPMRPKPDSASIAAIRSLAAPPSSYAVLPLSCTWLLKQKLQPHTAHTNNLVPMVYIGSKNITLDAGDLKDIAPTMLALMDLEIPSEMAGKSLINS